MSIWIVIVSVAVLSAGIKAVGPMVLGDHEFEPRTTRVIDALAPALLAGLVVVELLGQHWDGFDWTVLPGLAIGVSLRWVKLPDVACVVVAVAVTIVVRLLVG